MSANLKVSSNASTPIKLKPSSNLAASPARGNKYKNFLAAVLTPSQTKKWIKRKKSNKSNQSFDVNKSDAEDVYKSRLSDDLNEPGYSSVQDLQRKQIICQESVADSESYLSTKYEEQDHESSHHIYPKLLDQYTASSIEKEPLYATVNKQHKSKKEDFLNENLIEEQKEEIKLLVERMKELTKENRELHKHVETIMKEERWKEESLHAELKLKISQLEADTHKEVRCLSDQIQTLHKERKVLTDQITILHEEKKLLHLKYEDVCSKVKNMVTPEFLKRTMDEHQRSVTELKRKHLEEVKKLKQEIEVLQESKYSISDEVEDLRRKIKTLVTKNESLKSSEQELLQEKNRILLQLEESRQMQQESQNMLLALLKITENIAVERDVLLNKASYQDHQQILLKNSIMDYTLNMGRLQEHISNSSREKLEELQKLKTGELQRDESLKNFYGKQLDLLRSKVLNQNSTINDLESEKSKLELQLESLWQAAYVRKPNILEDSKYNF